MRIYTRTGDDGKTFCAALGGRVSKASVMIELVGALDEASTSVGVARAFCEERGCPRGIVELLEEAQRMLFLVGFAISGSRDFSGDEISRLEEAIDRLMQGIELKGFILPGGTPESSLIHLARTAVRRAERRFFAALEQGAIQGGERASYAGRLLNRLSDALFAAAVRIEHDRGALRYV